MRSRSSGSFTHHTNGFANALRRRDDLIEIAARDRAVPRVKAMRHDVDGEHVNVGRQRRR